MNKGKEGIRKRRSYEEKWACMIDGEFHIAYVAKGKAIAPTVM